MGPLLLEEMNSSSLDEMAIILQMAFSKAFLWVKSFVKVWISLKFVPKGPIDNKGALFQVMVWRQTGNKPLPELMLTQFTDANM